MQNPAYLWSLQDRRTGAGANTHELLVSVAEDPVDPVGDVLDGSDRVLLVVALQHEHDVVTPGSATQKRVSANGKRRRERRRRISPSGTHYTTKFRSSNQQMNCMFDQMCLFSFYLGNFFNFLFLQINAE